MESILKGEDSSNYIISRINTGCSILDSCWDSSNCRIYTANINGYIYEIDLENLNKTNTGECFPNRKVGAKSDLAVQQIKYNAKFNILVSISWDRKLQIIDLINGKSVTKALFNKPFTLDINDNGLLIVAAANNQIYIYDLNLPGSPLVETRESGLRFQTKEIKLRKEYPNRFDNTTVDNTHLFSTSESNRTLTDSKDIHEADFYVESSYESRVIVDFLQNQDLKFAFKCHKITSSDSIDMVSPINSINLFKDENNDHDLLYTAGSDGIINLWDLHKKKKLKKLKKFNQSVLRLDICYANDELLDLMNKIGSPDHKINHILAIVTGDDSFKNNRYLDNGTDNFFHKNNDTGCGNSDMVNVMDFSIKLYLKLM